MFALEILAQLAAASPSMNTHPQARARERHGEKASDVKSQR
jgi:hypothetical protein